MASVTTRPNGHRWITFKAPNGKRQTIRLGTATQQQATNFKDRVERLLVCRRVAETPDASTIEWLASLPDNIHDNLARCGLVAARGARTVGELVAWFIASKPRWKASTLVNVKTVGNSLERYFGRERKLFLITPDDAARYRDWLERGGRKNGQPYGATTASRMCRRAREIFAPAVERRAILANPFAKLKGWTDTNPERDEYVTRAQFEAVMLECSPETRLFFSLTRYAGLRGHSEIMPLEWTWLDWHHATLFVKAPKTARYEGHETRYVPIGEDLMRQLRDAHESAPEGVRLIFDGPQITSTAMNNRLAAACRRAGVVMWPKPKINLRASCENDWLRQHPIDMVAAWMGHSPETMLKHYNRVAKQQSAQMANSALHTPGGVSQRAS